MRTLIVTGHLGTDAELKVTKNANRPVLEFRLANHEYFDGEGVTYWYRVSSFNPSVINLKEHLKKGSYVNVIGTVKDNTYTAKTGTVEISRDIVADAVSFGDKGGGNGNGQQNVAETVAAQPTVTQTPPQAEAPKKTTKAKKETPMPTMEIPQTAPAPQPTAAATADDDDLPF